MSLFRNRTKNTTQLKVSKGLKIEEDLGMPCILQHLPNRRYSTPEKKKEKKKPHIEWVNNYYLPKYFILARKEGRITCTI